MQANKSDLTFFTNDGNHTLLDRFKATLADTMYFDVLVGYFHASGFHQLADDISKIGKTRILVGLGVDSEVFDALDMQRQGELDFESHARAKGLFKEELVKIVEHAPVRDEELEQGLTKFIQLLQENAVLPEEDKLRGGNGKKLEIRVYPSRNIHAKVYIGRFKPEDRDYGFVITGSSNFTYSGLVANREFNVELRQRRDVEFALDRFEELWRESVEVSRDFVDTVRSRTWLNDSISPYELYLKLLYEYLQEDINLQDDIEVFLPEGFIPLRYQKQAVVQALKKIEEYGGVFLSDVVGLGKTFIAAQLLQQVSGRILVICPPGLKNYWEESLQDFRVPAKVESLGKLDHLVKSDIRRYDYVVIDEAHRFRNENTQTYANLLDLCRGKKVILITATPLNNTIDDIYAQLKLFQSPKESTIPGIPNLDRYFGDLRKRLNGLDKGSPEYKAVVKEISKEIRERILKYVMVRRTRSDVLKWFKDDVASQNLSFPEVQQPRKIVYNFAGKVEDVFNETVRLLRSFRYARYIPLLYYRDGEALTEFERQQQRNVGGFMKGILIKRLESSFFAFRKSVARFVRSYEKFIEMYENGTVYIAKRADVYELLDNDDLETLDRLLAEEKAQMYASSDFSSDFIEDLRHDLRTLKAIQSLWQKVEQDPKLETFIRRLKTDPVLKDNRLVVFTESRETGEYLFEHLNREFPNEVLFFSSQGGRTASGNLSPAPARALIREAFDPTCKNHNDDLRILVSTDVLAEGINLHRAAVLVNYDLPWNPTRVLQRAGRINRLGTEHAQIFIYNFFPATQTDAHLGLEQNITNKIQMFHEILGEDAKYLSDGEEIGSQELFDTLNSQESYTGEGEEGDSELEYLDMLRRIRDEDPKLFEKIKRLPKKARSGRLVGGLSGDRLVTFFRVGKLKKFYCNASGESKEITFFDAVGLLKCAPDTPRHPVPANYHANLLANRQKFEQDSIQSAEPAKEKRGGRSNLSYIEKRLRDRAFRNCRKFTDADDEFIEGVRRMLSQGTVAKKVAQAIKKEFEKTLDPLEMLAILRKHIRVLDDPGRRRGDGKQARREVILSGYLIAKGGA